MTIKVCVPRDAAALSVGADATAAAIAKAARRAGHAIQLVRTSSRGMLWLEPLVEIQTQVGASPTDR
jgi:formate dehydrogenase iron-sulfur subunit